MDAASPWPGLHDRRGGRASCGVGAIVDLGGGASHRVVALALAALQRLGHRGARGADEACGDGAGILLQKPHAFFARILPGLPGADAYGVGQILAAQDSAGEAMRRLVERAAADDGFEVLAWRRVPTEPGVLGRAARLSEPAVWQCFVAPRRALPPATLDLRLYLLRRLIEQRARGEPPGLYVCSLDRRRLVYKGLLTSAQLAAYYPDLGDPDMASALALVHARFSTNTLGAWPLAHPYRCIVHNGEFNTLRGNRNWMRAREQALASPHFGADVARLRALIDERASDSASFDAVLELLLLGGRSLPHALRMMIPEAWEGDPSMDAGRRAFYAYHACLMEPWDGPALVVASDGEQVAAVLDRNGLRPCRSALTADGLLVLGSEAGLLARPPSAFVMKGRLKPGELLVADTRSRRIVPEHELFAGLTTAAPYAEWLARERVQLAAPSPAPTPAATPSAQAVARWQAAFGYSLETLRCLLQAMAAEGKDPLGSMGSDTPPAFLSARHRPLFHYFSQLFAQVSNPPIDHLREAVVTSLGGQLGPQRNLLAATPAHCRRLRLESPLLDGDGRAALDALRPRLPLACLDTTCAPDETLAAALDRLEAAAQAALAGGAALLVLSDRDVAAARMAIPSLLALGAVHHHLLRQGLRAAAGLVVESGEPFAVHHFSTLIGYGADAVFPWLAWHSVDRLVADGELAADAVLARRRYRAAVEGGLLKVMAKMGISTLEAYKGAQLFEAVGLAPELVRRCFEGTSCSVPGVDLDGLERESRERHRLAFASGAADSPALEAGGDYYWRRAGEQHAWNPLSIGRLQQAVRNEDYRAFTAYTAEVDGLELPPASLRALLEFVPDPAGGIPVDEVEPVEAILPRLSTGSMSFGALSREAHEALAIAMNRIDGKAGSGEGGEHPERFGTARACSMKQVASGRFGVTIEYLAGARQIEIKMAQGAKPGEGGELPAGKVDADIAAARHTTPGVGLISPPPHHDIYSIEDLAQLIHDLKCTNPGAEVHVKLVAEAGVGTIAAGVAKARADAILISGDSGGTGAALKTSIKNAGAPWELGLAETQQVLLANGLRSRVRLRVDGGLRSGRDVAIAALFGAEEFGFGSAALVALGCIMLRKCHCNTCSAGIATQDPALRARFAGRPEHVVTLMRFIARQLREIMARLGFRRVDDMIGRVDRLRQRPVALAKGIRTDLSRLLHRPLAEDAPRCTRQQDHQLEAQPDHRLVAAAAAAIARGEAVHLALEVGNGDRAVGALLSGELVRRRGRAPPLAAATVSVHCHGTAGQSFGAFLATGIELRLRGEANDYAGKGLSGGRLVVATPADAGYAAAANIIVGNAVLYGATSGEAYFNGLAGERFAVRNSGALAVVEGTGDHACEYMTGGAVVILGATGRNFGAGMSGGEAYVLDEDGRFPTRLNADMVRLETVEDADDLALLLHLLRNHVALTGSALARRVLAHWPTLRPCFVKVMPLAHAARLARARTPARALPAATAVPEADSR
ncbi:glutamate synthase large subunit [Thauera sp.]|uniref:glutamate synthase large subunit n=1 Tax=Thauera sp. TaxID=1905334 RepID=UPI002C06B3C2|nr:glutamate synthase large subunit [Thauera sp.]HRP22348.1 glutamate synthase large subunit [Thauera sp.]